MKRITVQFIFVVSISLIIHLPLDKAADILAALCMRLSFSLERPLPAAQVPTQEAPTWLLKANVTVFRHADRTPKVQLSSASAHPPLTLVSIRSKN
jgi:hypothetical protein